MRTLIIQAETGGLDGTVHSQQAGARSSAFQQVRQTRRVLAAPEGGNQ